MFYECFFRQREGEKKWGPIRSHLISCLRKENRLLSFIQARKCQAKRYPTAIFLPLRGDFLPFLSPLIDAKTFPTRDFEGREMR